MNSLLKQQTVTGMAWSIFQRFGTMGISFISNIVLARLLSPDDYGCIGMLMIFIALSNTFIDGGFGSALIQKKRPTREDYSTIFYWNVALSVALYCVLFIGAPLVADFYNIVLLSRVLRVEGIILIINAFGIVQANQLRKQLQFKSIAKVTLIATVMSVVVAIVMAYMGYGIWSLVAQQIVSSLASTLLYWVYSPWRPSRVFSWASFKELFGFGSFMLLSSLINAFCNNLNGLLIGKFFNASSMGYFTQSKKLEDVFSSSIEAVVGQVTYPVLVEVKDKKEKLKGMLAQFNSLLLYVVAPLMLLLNLLATPIVVLLLGEKWLPAVPYLEILAFQGIAISIQNINYNAVASIGRSKTLFISTLVKRCFSVAALVFGMRWGGVNGLLWGMVLSSYFICSYNLIMVHRYIGYRLWKQIIDLLPIISINVITYAVVYVIRLYIPLNGGTLYGVMFVTYVCLYLLLSYVFKVRTLFLVCDIIKDIFKRFDK